MPKEKIMFQFIPTGNGNTVLRADGFFISYNPMPMMGNGAETALCLNNDQKIAYYILNGDFRKEYTELAKKGFDACKEFYDAHPGLRSGWSTDDDEYEDENDNEE